MSQFTVLPELAVTASNPSVGPNGSPIPGDATLVGGENPSGNLEPLQTDSSGNLLVNIAGSSGTGNVNLVEVGGAAITEGQKTMANSLPVVVASDQSTLPVSAASLPLPTGAATSANQTNASQKTQIVDGSGNVIASTSNALNVQVENFPSFPVLQNVNLTEVGGAAITEGQKTMANSLPVAIASDQSAITVAQATAANLNATVVQATASNLNAAVVGIGTAGSPSGGVVSIQGVTSGQAVPVSGTVTATNSANGNTGSAVPTQATQVGGTDGTNLRALSVNTSGQLNVNNISGTVSLPTGASTAANQTAVQGSPSGGTAATNSQLAGGIYNSTPPTLTNGQQASIQFDAAGQLKVAASVTSTAPTASTSTLTNVNGSASSVSLLASNSSRKGAAFYNDSSATLYLKYGTTASTTSYTVQIPGNGYYELVTTAVYTGAIDGIWSSATGAVRITELS